MSERERQTRRLRLAMFSPLPPSPTGIADYTADLLPLLPPEWEIELFVDGSPSDTQCSRASVWPHGEWRQRAGARAFDLHIYQVGNNPAHAYTLPYVRETPGLLILHDAVLHPARAAAYIGAVDMPGYRAVAEASDGATGAALAHLVAAGLGSPAVYWRFPLCADLVRASLRTAVHGNLLARWLRALVPEGEIGSIVHWRAVPEVSRQKIDAWRERLGAGAGVSLLGSFGHFGAAHRLDVVLEALALLAPEYSFQVVMAGEADPALNLPQRALALGLGERIHWTGTVGASDFAALLRAVDIGLNLRYPTARSSSGTLQQLLQLGVPTAISDLVHLRDLPDAAVLRIPVADRSEEIERLRIGLARWLRAPRLRADAGAAAATWAAREITPERMVEGYVEAVAQALKRRDAA